jgi:hypothetical protein
MSWEGFMEMERLQLRERREGKLRRTLGVPLPGETGELLDRLGEQDQLRAEQRLVVTGSHGRIYYKHIDDLSRHDMRLRTAAERKQIAWLAERLECRKRGGAAPPVPDYLG